MSNSQQAEERPKGLRSWAPSRALTGQRATLYGNFEPSSSEGRATGFKARVVQCTSVRRRIRCEGAVFAEIWTARLLGQSTRRDLQGMWHPVAQLAKDGFPALQQLESGPLPCTK